jgi:hypothetical protein
VDGVEKQKRVDELYRQYSRLLLEANDENRYADAMIYRDIRLDLLPLVTAKILLDEKLDEKQKQPNQ